MKPDPLPLYDAHNHLQDERFDGRQPDLLAAAKAEGVEAMVVNGSSPGDWDRVLKLASLDPAVIPSLGVHPWYHHELPRDWREQLEAHLRKGRAAVGEIGLDRWKADLPYEGQEEVFLAQWHLARKLHRPASLHCLKAWGRLLELLQEHPGPECGFVLHSYGGPAEMIPAFSRLGAYFSFPGDFLQARKERQREAFRHVPLERLLVETDAPDQRLPDELNRYPLTDAEGQSINHPANLRSVYEGLAGVLDLRLEDLAGPVAQNFRTLFLAS